MQLVFVLSRDVKVETVETYDYAQTEILEFYPAQPEDHLARSSQSPKFTFKYVTRRAGVGSS
jgi:hypothetical protein